MFKVFKKITSALIILGFLQILFATENSSARKSHSQCLMDASRQIISDLNDEILSASDPTQIHFLSLLKRNRKEALLYFARERELLENETLQKLVLEQIRLSKLDTDEEWFQEFDQIVKRRISENQRNNLERPNFYVQLHAIAFERTQQKYISAIYDRRNKRQLRRPSYDSFGQQLQHSDSKIDKSFANLRVSNFDENHILIDSLEPQFQASAHDIGGDNQLGDIAAFLEAAGPRLASIFDFKLLSVRRLLAPRARIIQRAIRRLNVFLPERERISLNFEESHGLADERSYESLYTNKRIISFSDHGLQLAHDLAFHLASIFIPPPFLDHAQKLFDAFNGFEQFLQKAAPHLMARADVQKVFTQEHGSNAVRIDSGTGNFGGNIGAALELTKVGSQSANTWWQDIYQSSIEGLMAKGISPRRALKNFIRGKFIEQTITHDRSRREVRATFPRDIRLELEALLDQFLRSGTVAGVDDTMHVSLQDFRRMTTARVLQIRNAAWQIQDYN